MIYRFGDVAIDPDGRELRCAGEVVAVEPRAFDLLVYLIEHRDRAVPRDELLDAVWDGRVVGDAALTQSVAKLRRLIDPYAPDCLRTIHRTGYRFVAELEDVARGDRSEYRSRLVWAVVGVFAVALSGAAWVSMQTIEEPAATRIGIAPFSYSTDSGNDSHQLITEALRLRFMDSGEIHVRDLGYAANAYNPSDALGSARRMSVDWLLAGELEVIPGSPSDRLTVRLWSVEEGRQFHLGVYSLPRVEQASDLSHLLSVRDTIVDYTLERLPGYVPLGNPDQDLPTSMADYEIYSTAQARLDVEACDPTIADTLEPVVERNPGFSLAWMALSYAHYNRFWACGGGPDSIERAVAAADALLAIAPDFVEAINAKALALTSGGRIAEARAMVEAELVRHPESPILHAVHANVLGYMGEIDAAVVAIRKALQLDPLVMAADLGGSPNVLLYGGHWREYLAAQPVSEAPYFSFQRAYALYRSGNPNAALSVLEPMIGKHPSALYARYGDALRSVIEGRPERAATILAGIAEQRDAVGHADGEVAYREAVLLMLSQQPERALERLQLATEQGFACADCVRIDPVWQEVRDSAGYREWAAQARAAASMAALSL